MSITIQNSKVIREVDCPRTLESLAVHVYHFSVVVDVHTIWPLMDNDESWRFGTWSSLQGDASFVLLGKEYSLTLKVCTWYLPL